MKIMSQMDIEAERISELLLLSDMSSSCYSDGISHKFQIGSTGAYKVILEFENSNFVIAKEKCYFQNSKIEKIITDKVLKILNSKEMILSDQENRRKNTNKKIDRMLINAKNRI
ncbi:hypothetical protein BDD43_2813 [Mucilaginibacter gracilis]|uniref:Uncharacterized protein n=1 Tax=Mucilaginibacter gracilis TaxID=423350 RepID=A0A495J2N0_9SPHI|nr:hypothetical protein [Mucilaginibacter gracilis]RKR82628.1 hypothetical protein BDD43_2813 [Mucilaginibacter gracilis]